MKLIRELSRPPTRAIGAIADVERHQGASAEFGAMGFTQISTRPNIFGGRDVYRNGFEVAHSMPNIFGGEDVYRGGVLASQSRPNIFGGFDTTQMSLHGGGGLEHAESALEFILGYDGSSHGE